MNSPDKNKGFNPLHYLFLMSFLHPRPIDKDPDMPGWWSFPNWNAALGESSNELMSRFIEVGLVQQCSDEKHLDYWYQEQELRNILTKYGRKPDGIKSALVERAITLDKPETRLARDEFTLYECTDAGKGEIERYLSAISAAKGVSPQRAIIWILSTAIAGFIGNRADAILLQAARYLLGEGGKGASSSLPVGYQGNEPEESIDSGMMIWLYAYTDDDETEDAHSHVYVDLEYVCYNLDRKELAVAWSVGVDVESLDNPVVGADLWLSDLEVIFTEADSRKEHIRKVRRQNIKLLPEAVYGQTERFSCQFPEVINGELEIRCRFQVQCTDSRDHSVRNVTENIKYWFYDEDVCLDDGVDVAMIKRALRQNR
jgi:hypothetical protein